MDTKEAKGPDEKKKTAAELLATLMEGVDRMGMSLIMLSLAPIFMKKSCVESDDVRKTDPELYYSSKTKLREMAKSLRKAADELEKEIAELE